MMNNGALDFYRGKKVFLTGHTGFKGSWLCRILSNAGAEVTGYSTDPPTKPSLFTLAGIRDCVRDIRGDVRDFEALKTAFEEAKPEIVLHLAAQPIVRESYRHPRYTYETNVMGTVNLLECVRNSEYVRSAVNVTTDKVYFNNKLKRPYSEEDPLDGFDPYSNSKSCSELVTHSYIRSFFGDKGIGVSTARAGNVIGGGDFSADRIIPDCVRAVMAGEPIIVRNPHSVRPYQHVLEPLMAYLLIAEMQYKDSSYAGYYNIGPDVDSCLTTRELVRLFCECWGKEAHWEERKEQNAPHEDDLLMLDCTRIKDILDWHARWTAAEAVQRVVEWTKTWANGGDVSKEMDRQIDLYAEAWYAHVE